MQVTKIVGNTVHLRREDGKEIEIEKKILAEDSYSADHFDRSVTCSMTELAEILNDAKDTIFTVNFKCQPNQETVSEKLKGLDINSVKNEAEIKKLTKSLIEGEESTIIGHLADGSHCFGRTLVIDLESGGFKQVDHRTIQWIVLRNTKYVLGKKSGTAIEAPAKTAEKWDINKLAPGNWFSEIAYYKFQKMSGKEFEVTITKESGVETYLISSD